MKKISSKLLMLMALVATFVACEPDVKDPNVGGEDASSTHHLDLWLSVVGTTNTGSYVTSNFNVNKVDTTIHVNGVGAEATTLVSNAIQKGKYYYFTTADNLGMAKYLVKDNKITEVAACPFKKNVFKRGTMTVGMTVSHEWIGNDVLMLMAYSSTTKKHIWTKFNTSTMTIVAEGEFDLHAKYADLTGNSDGTTGVYKFSTSGHTRYRASDGKLLFFTSIHFLGEGKHPMHGGPNTKRGPLAVVVLDEKTMEIEEANADDRVSGLGLESYGDTQQEKAFTTPEGDIYLICLEGGSTYSPGGPAREGVFVRVKAGQNNTDRSYLFAPTAKEDFLVVRYIAPGKALVFSGNHAEYAYDPAKRSFNSYAYYYAVFNYESKTLDKIQFEGKDLPWSTGSFQNYMAIIGDKAYMGINGKSDETYEHEWSFGGYSGTDIMNYPSSAVYVYDIKTGAVTEGFKIDEKLRFDRMFAVEND